MIDKNKIIEFFENNDLSDVEEVSDKDGVSVFRFFYDFDEAELKSARAYADDQSNAESESDDWYDEFYLPYLNDLAIDNIGDIMQESMEKFQLEAQYVSYEADKENNDYCEFIAVFYEKGKEIEIEDILDELDI